MIQYQTIPTLDLSDQQLFIRHQELPQVAHFDDPAIDVMRDYQVESAYSISPNETIDHALLEINTQNILTLLVINENNEIEGIISIEDILGEKPITLLEKSRISRESITVNMVMTPIKEIVILSKDSVLVSKVGNITETLRINKAKYALVIEHKNKHTQHEAIGLYNLSQLQQLLHTNIRLQKENSSVAELTKKKK